MSTMRENFSCSYTFASQQQQSQTEVRQIAPLGPLAPLLHLYRRLCLYSKKAHLPQTAVETDPQGFVLEYTSSLLVHTSCQYSYSFHEWIMIVSLLFISENILYVHVRLIQIAGRERLPNGPSSCTHNM